MSETTKPKVTTLLIEDGVDRELDVQAKILDHHLTTDPGDRLLSLSQPATSERGSLVLSVTMLRRVLAAVDEEGKR